MRALTRWSEKRIHCKVCQATYSRAIDRMVAAAGHIRDCPRCRRVYGVAFEIVLEALRKEYSTLYWEYPPPFRVLEQCFRELHDCEHWPVGI
jgi:hypothetical protein